MNVYPMELVLAEARKLQEQATALQVENAKLRELCLEMFNACPMCIKCAHNHLTVGWYERMQGLGIEAWK